MSCAYYNEHDPFAAAWLRNLIADDLIAPGEVDERDIRDVCPSDLHGFTQCHFFAGIGGWALALRIAGWPDVRPVWTGSCPCQPYSAAGRGGGFADERHLWPAWFHLVRECRPPVVFGEQVEAAVRHGWLDLVFADLEGESYACGATVLGAHSVRAPHIRQRLWFVADADSDRCSANAGRKLHYATYNFESCGSIYKLADARGGRLRRRSEHGSRASSPNPLCGEAREQRLWAHDGDGRAIDKLADARSERRRQVGAIGGAIGGGRGEGSRAQGLVERSVHGGDGELADADNVHVKGGERNGDDARFGQKPNQRQVGLRGPWDDLEWLPCRDGKARPTQRRFQSVDDGLWPSMVGRGEAYLAPLAPNQKNRVGMLRGAGNAIVSQVAAEVILAFLECRP